ncbi:GNAT family N-acetyltransferase [Shewanella sp. Scap07]|uniref:GNAT family N-acetyltransferase n=1 Tax=Shewanella sp. Scap07 TaxID=2589987 RepID=UPI0015BD7FC7|nr:GNAT family N-acetyltransferase [Shewanella sp. Scap07]QLE86402.1 GNAT family N-acetyltransferase [Shewanella sp. Scap07]
MKVTIDNHPPTLEEFITLRAKVGWGDTPLQLAKSALDNSFYHVVARNDDTLIGMARIVGDGAMFFYIQDLAVEPEYQNKGIGNLLMKRLESYLSTVASTGATIGLLSAKGQEDFYSRYGYVGRTGSPLGLGMCKFV